MNRVRVLPAEIVRVGHHAIPGELHPASTQSLWPAIITAAATVGLALLAFWQIRAGREASQRQWQPRVFVHGWTGPYNKNNPDPNAMAVPYYLSNEGTGPAFNVEHGVEVAGEIYTPGGQLHRIIRAGDEIPPMLDSIGMPVSLSPIVVNVKLGEWTEKDIVYWARFENLLGEHFEVRNFPDPTRPAAFRRVSQAGRRSTRRT